jgi:hypothetical protein
MYTRENYSPRRLILYFDVFFAFGDILMRVEKMEGKKEKKKSLQGKWTFFRSRRRKTPPRREEIALRCWIEFDFLISQTWIEAEAKKSPAKKFSGKIIRLVVVMKSRSTPALGDDWFLSNSRLHFVILTHAETVALTFQLFLRFMNH